MFLPKKKKTKQNNPPQIKFANIFFRARSSYKQLSLVSNLIIALKLLHPFKMNHYSTLFNFTLFPPILHASPCCSWFHHQKWKTQNYPNKIKIHLPFGKRHRQLRFDDHIEYASLCRFHGTYNDLNEAVITRIYLLRSRLSRPLSTFIFPSFN